MRNLLANPRLLAGLALIVLLALVPVYVQLSGSGFALVLATRAVILAVAAVSLNLILGYGGMVSFGHALYLGVGAYAVGIPIYHGVESGFVHLALAIGVSALVALFVGLLSLRTRGIFFIMITLAFAQMFFYLAQGAYEYGGDDGMTVWSRSDFGRALDLSNKTLFYYLCLAVLCLALFLCHRFVNARFGMALRGARSNDRRMRALGFPTFRYRLAAFVIAGTLCGLAGALLANDAEFVSPATMHWTRSGDLIVIVVLGGMGTLFGPLFGTFAFLVLEEVLQSLTEHWMLIFGPFLVLMVLFARRGIAGLLPGGGRE